MNTARTRSPAASPRGFTLIELLVALGALAFVAVGIAAIFESIGRTISAGKRVSAFSQYAAAIQQQMGADIASMTTDGFLVIRNEYAGADPSLNSGRPQPVELFDGDTAPRPRRVDQFMFFAKGKFTSARDPLSPSAVARADAARVYFGHGQRAVPSTSPTSRYLQPLPGDDSTVLPERGATFLGVASASISNPNRYASDWTLLRHVTLLAAPRTATQTPGTVSVLGIPPTSPRLLDSNSQIAMQPAAWSLFRRLIAQPQPVSPSAPAPQLVRGDYPGLSPSFSSGIVDIAATDLGQIRLIVTTADTWPRVPLGVTGAQALGTSFYNTQSLPDGQNTGADGKFRICPDPASPVPATASEDRFVVQRMQAWMDDAWPTSNLIGDPAAPRERVRYEPAPPALLATASASTALERAFRRADQAMLVQSSFVPKCTEFIVEWSFGNTFPTEPTQPGYIASLAGKTIWHGMERWTQPTAGNWIAFDPATVSAVNPPPEVFPYVENFAQRPLVGTPLANNTGNALGRAVAFAQDVPLNNGSTKRFFTKAGLIHGQTYIDQSVISDPATPLESYFGYVDPTFQPDGFGAPPINPPDPALSNQNGSLNDQFDAASPTVQWPWPKLVRVTLSIADPGDPAFEQTFQFVFEIPAKAR